MRLHDEAKTEGDTGTGAADTAAKTEAAVTTTTEAPKTEAAPAKTEAAKTETTTDAPKTDAPKTEAAKPAPVEIKLELPKDSKLHQTDVDRIAATARERGLSQEQANALLTEAETATRGYEARQQEMVAARRTEWVSKVKADPELGGANFERTTQLGNIVIERFMSPELRADLRATPFGDHPEFVRFLATIGRAMAEDSPPSDGKPTFAKRSYADIIYGTPNS